MDIGMIGLGRMGANMAERLVKAGHNVHGFDPADKARDAAKKQGITPVDSLKALIDALPAPRAVWMMVPAGKIVDETIDALRPLLSKGDTIIDGGNSFYQDSMKRFESLKGDGIHYVDCGTSGGVWGLKEGYSMMIGGEDKAVAALEPVFKALAPAADKGWGHVGKPGAGHFTKMVHNGVEYGLMQAYAEGFSIMKHKTDFALDLHQVAEVWRTGSVVRSWLLDLTSDALGKNPKLDGIKPWVADSGEGRWTAAEAIALDVPAPVITLSLIERLRSRDDDSFGDKLLSAMRNEFGGHAVNKMD